MGAVPEEASRRTEESWWVRRTSGGFGESGTVGRIRLLRPLIRSLRILSAQMGILVNRVLEVQEQQQLPPGLLQGIIISTGSLRDPHQLRPQLRTTIGFNQRVLVLAPGLVRGLSGLAFRAARESL